MFVVMFRRLFLLGTVATSAWCATRPLPIAFEVNRGQASGEFGFVSHTQQYSVSLSATRIEWASGQSRISAVLEGARAAAPGVSEDPLPGVVNYLRGRNESEWLLNIPTSRRVRYSRIYRGIDVVYYGRDGRLEYDFILRPGADPKQIQMRYKGAQSVRVSRDGNLLLKTAAGTLEQQKPTAYQEIGGKRQAIEARYIVRGASVQLEVARYDHSQQLTIDPPLTWATYSSFRSSSAEIDGVATDPAGNVYVTGYEISAAGDADCMVAELNSSGTAVVFKTVLAGTGDDAGYAITLDPSGSIYVTGQTSSNDFPTMGPNQNLAGLGVDAFAVKLDHTGRIVYSTYLGGSLTDVGYALALDLSNNLYVAGGTQSNDFPHTGNAFQGALNGGVDAFLTVFDPSGNLMYSTFLGGSSDDVAYGVAVDLGYSVYLTGTTASANFPVTPAAIQPHSAGGVDGFVTKLAAFGAPLYSTYLGGSGDDFPVGIVVDHTGAAYITGDTSSANFPTKSAFQGQFYGKRDIFGSKLSPDGSQFVYSTYVGGSGTDTATGIALDASGSLYIAGQSDSEDFPTVNAFAPSRKGVANAIVAALGPTGTTLQFSTFLGGSNHDGANGIALNCGAGVFVGGTTVSVDFPVTAGAMQQTFGSSQQDGFVANIGVSPMLPAIADGGVQNGATFEATQVAPGSVVTIKGMNLAGLTASALAFPLSTGMGGVSVSVNGTPAPLFYVSPTQINIQVPYEAAPGSAALSVNACGGTSPVASFKVVPAAPYILLGGNGQGLIQNPDYSLNTPTRPAHPGDAIVVYLIGIGAVDNPVTSGTPASGSVLAHAKAPSTATIGGQNARVLFLGLTPNFVSLAQANVVVPNLPSGTYDVSLNVGGVTSNTVKLYVQ